MLAILRIFVEQRRGDEAAKELSKLPEVIDLYEVAGECDLMALASFETLKEFRDFLNKRALNIEGVKGAVTVMVSHVHKKGGRMVYE